MTDQATTLPLYSQATRARLVKTGLPDTRWILWFSHMHGSPEVRFTFASERPDHWLTGTDLGVTDAVVEAVDLALKTAGYDIAGRPRHVDDVLIADWDLTPQ